MSETYRPLVFSLSAIGSLTSHGGGDYVVQSDWCARYKQTRSPEGRRALAAHGATYGLAQLATRIGVCATAGLRVPLLAQLAGTSVEVVLHVLVDDGRLLRWLAESTGKGGFHALGGPRPVVGVIDESDGETEAVRRMYLVDAALDGTPMVDRDEYGRIVGTHAHDNANPSTGRALMDQALHTWVQVLAGAAVTTAVAARLARRR
ncbi:hypothetical protein [Saccharopolyspora cebuensis]|uniref:hypothetical protein n=1 Tax=Saccharopolyspora cebuensis TaxID=418759 RepID=UPI0031EAB854